MDNGFNAPHSGEHAPAFLATSAEDPNSKPTPKIDTMKNKMNTKMNYTAEEIQELADRTLHLLPKMRTSKTRYERDTLAEDLDTIAPTEEAETLPESELEADEIEIADEASYGGNRATYCPEDDKIRLYVGRVPRDEYLVLKAEGWTSTPKQSCDFVAVWTPKRKARAISYAGIIEDEDASPADRAADRAERFAMYRDKRTSEATGHADRYDAGPSAFGYQDKGRAVRAADRHDHIATRACDAWSKAEYWTARTAGVISNALHKASASVRLGRIKELELAIARYEGYPAHYGEMLAHLKLRLAYENQMIEAQGGRAACVEMEPGGFIGSHQIHKVTRSPVTGQVVSVELRYMSECNQYGSPWRDGKGARMLSMLYNIERLPANAYRAPTDEERAEFDGALKAKRKANAAAAKAKASKGENCPLVNPTDEDAERLQAIWNERAQEAHADHLRRNGYASEFIPAQVKRMTQDRYSYLSSGRGHMETTAICGNGEKQALNTYSRQDERKKQGPAVCKVRTGYNTGWHTPRSVIILTDKPQKALPAKVWQPYTPPAPAEALATVTA